jgi:hypothetical protein
MDQTRDVEAMDVQRQRRPLTTFGKITLAALLALVVLFVFQQVAIFKAFFPPVGIVQAALTLLIAGIVATGRRWTPAVGALWCGLLVLGSLPMTIHHLGNPGEDILDFVFTLVALLLILIGVVAGIAATVQNYSRRG